ncbi:MAG TPA: GTPase [Candidatus Angelobacter sp.]|nr:GTPase [Candidatus Angelobacter sp.]
MASHDDVKLNAVALPLEPLPPVDWASIGQVAPTPIPIGARQPGDPLPAADIVVLTWTSAEWSALDQVFLGTNTSRYATDWEWKKSWQLYSRGASGYVADEQSGPLWGFFQLVRIQDQSRRPWRVLLFKSNSHLAHSPWIDGLSTMLRCILEDTKADRIYSIGTAGGARLGQSLGDAVVTNAALLDLQRPQNTANAGNGQMFRCPTWFPSSGLSKKVQESLLFRMNRIVTRTALEQLFAQLQAKHAGDPNLAGITLADLINDPIEPDKLGTPRVLHMKDVPLLSTDFYYIAGGSESDAYSFLEMDDAVIAREAQSVGVRYAFVRNVSDPVVNSRTQSGKPIADSIRSDWSGEIYQRYGFQTSYNGALAAWATIAGEGEAAYNPPRSTNFPPGPDPLEVELVRQVRSCGSCSFFWPQDKSKQSYGPYTSYDFDINAPYAGAYKPGSVSSPWVLGRTRPPAFPEAEVIDGCRKAPIMTIGINPNLTAFAPGQTGAAWCYPSFFSDDGSDAWAKYAWYYRYRSVYQERLSLDFVRRFILPEGRIYAPRAGVITAATRVDSSPAWNIKVRYEGDAEDTTIQFPGQPGDFPYVLLFDALPPNNTFSAGDVIAGRLAVPGGIQVEVQQQQQTYYMQFVPVLDRFQDTLQKAGHPYASLRVGEDVCQLDMVACASPHWNAGFLGGSQQSIDTIVNNCVSSNAWAMKQLVQTRPAVLYIVSESSWKMFNGAFGAHVRRDPPLSANPVDHDFTLLRETTDPNHPCNFVIDVNIDGVPYQCTTRIVITPHFSYNDNFLSQYRLSQPDWKNFLQTQAACAAALTPQNGFSIVPADPKYPNNYAVIHLSADAQNTAAARAWLQQQFPAASKILEAYYFDAYGMMAAVLDDLFKQGTLAWQDQDKGTGFLARTSGSCQFCVNQHWQFPLGCPYGKTKEQPPPSGFLEKVAKQVVATGKPFAGAAGAS